MTRQLGLREPQVPTSPGEGIPLGRRLREGGGSHLSGAHAPTTEGTEREADASARQ